MFTIIKCPTCKGDVEINIAKAIDELVEVYVTGKNFEWTYIKTHENDWCGPYFMKKNTPFLYF